MTLWILCEHGEAKAHDVRVRAFQRETNGTPCPGGRPALLTDLVSALRAEGVLVEEDVIHEQGSGLVTRRYVTKWETFAEAQHA